MPKRTLFVLTVNGRAQTDCILCAACLSPQNKDFEELNYSGSKRWREFDADKNPELSCKSCGYPIEERAAEEDRRADGEGIIWS